MKVLKHLFTTRLWIALFMLFWMGSSPLFAQIVDGASGSLGKDILLYSTNFKNWDNVSQISNSSNYYPIGGTSAGAGFWISEDGTINNGTGMYRIGSGSGRRFGIKPLPYVSGAVVELLIDLAPTTSNRAIAIYNAMENGTSLVTFGQVEMFNLTAGTPNFTNLKAGNTSLNGTPNTVLDNTKLGKWYTGASVQVPQTATGQARISFYIPSGLTASTLLCLDNMRSDIPIRELKVYTSVGTTPYVASTNYSKYPASGHQMKGTAGGAVNSGTTINAVPNVKLWNNTGNVKMTIEGTDAAKFSIVGADTDGSLTITNAQATSATGYDVPINFTPSVRDGISEAKLKIEAVGCSACQPYYVKLTGITGGATPQIVADNTPITFWTSPIKPTVFNLDVSGLNLTGPITIAFSDSGASSFGVPDLIISNNDALSGTILPIKFTGDGIASTKTATLTLTSPGATPVTIQLTGITLDKKPNLYNLAFVVDPAGTAYINTSPAGSVFLEGTKVTVTITPETDWKVKSWSDVSANKAVTRDFIVGEKKNTDNGQPIIIFMEPGQQGTVITPTGSLVAFVPTTISNTGFTCSWSQPALATATTVYTITIYDSTGTAIQTQTSTPGGSSLVITGLNPASFYTYTVSATTSDGGSGTTNHLTDKIGPIKTTGIVPFTCGN